MTQQQLVGDSPVIVKLQQTVKRIAAFPRPVLVSGERGVGKELVACLLHNLSPRKDKPFVEFNSAGIAPGLMASEIFGHEKGSFTSSSNQRIGRLEQANGGTLFLDEIGNMPLELQRMLLRVIEYQRFERVGGSEKIEVDVRIIAATNADLEEKIAGGSFHADLYDRIKYAEITVPPLRDHREDIPDLARFFLRRLREEMPWLKPVALADEAIVDLALRPWHGNIRELRATVESAAVLAESNLVRSRDLPEASRAAGQAGSFCERVAAFEQKLLTEALETTANRKQAAEALQLSYDQLRRLLKKHNL